MTVSGGIWFHVSIWEINSGEGGDSSESGGGQAARKLVEWGPKGLVISALVLNDVEGTEATMAVSTNRDECVSFLLCLQSSVLALTMIILLQRALHPHSLSQSHAEQEERQ